MLKHIFQPFLASPTRGPGNTEQSLAWLLLRLPKPGGETAISRI